MRRYAPHEGTRSTRKHSNQHPFNSHLISHPFPSLLLPTTHTQDLIAEFKNMPPSPTLLYSSIEAVFNHKNLWISRTILDPARIRYDFEDPKYWTAFVEPRMASQGMPKAFPGPRQGIAKPLGCGDHFRFGFHFRQTVDRFA